MDRLDLKSFWAGNTYADESVAFCFLLLHPLPLQLTVKFLLQKRICYHLGLFRKSLPFCSRVVFAIAFGHPSYSRRIHSKAFVVVSPTMWNLFASMLNSFQSFHLKLKETQQCLSKGHFKSYSIVSIFFYMHLIYSICFHKFPFKNF